MILATAVARVTLDPGEQARRCGHYIHHAGQAADHAPTKLNRAPSVGPVETPGGQCYLPGMVDTAFDTLAVTRQLKARGFDADQAEAITEVVRAGVTGGVATKADLAELGGDFAKLGGEMAEIRNDLLWVRRIGAAIVAILLASSGFAFSMLIDMNARIAALASGG